MWGENLLCYVCCGPQHKKQSGVCEMVLVQKRHVTTWQVKPCPFVLQTSLTQVVFSWSNTLDVFPPTILPFLPPMFSCCVLCYHDYVLWDKRSPHLCYFYMSFNNCFSRWASLYWWLSYISSIYMYDIFLDEHVCTSYFSPIHVFYYHNAFIKWPLTTVTLCVPVANMLRFLPLRISKVSTLSISRVYIYEVEEKAKFYDNLQEQDMSCFGHLNT